MTEDRKFSLTLILRDDQGGTKAKLDDVPEKTLRENPVLASLLRMHDTFMPQVENAPDKSESEA